MHSNGDLPFSSDKLIDKTADFRPGQEGSSAHSAVVESGNDDTIDTAGLHIRCPHCSNDVELLVHTPFEEISCDSCGSYFNLCERTENTRAASALQRVDRFELVSRLGMGGFGTVWKARDTELDRIVAIKFPRRGQLSEEEAGQFFREARAAAQLNHPNIVPVHEVGRHDEAFFIVSDLVRGVDLSDWMTAKHPNAVEVLEILLPITDALQHAHQQGVIHRDLKPANIMLDGKNRPFLMDFGLAKREFGEITMTVDGQILGTPSYMSPEQAGGKSHWTDRRTDIYSLGVILFYMLTGELPFRGNAQMQLHQKLHEDPPSPRKLNRHISKDLETICLKCMERDPNKRYATAEELAAEFRAVLSGMPIQARPISRVAKLARWAKRKPALATIAGLIALLAILGPSMALMYRREAQLLNERNRLITQAAERTQDRAKMNQLHVRLKGLENGANPWEFWPPLPSSSPQQQVLEQLFKKRYPEWQTAFSSLPEGSLEAAYGQLALGRLALHEGDHAIADSHLRKAKKILNLFSNDDAARDEIDVLRLDCLEMLAHATAKSSPQESKEFMGAALTERTRRKDGEMGQSINELANSLDLELRSAVASGMQDGKEHLENAQQLFQQIQKAAPDDPEKLYDALRKLTGRATVTSNSN